MWSISTLGLGVNDLASRPIPVVRLPYFLNRSLRPHHLTTQVHGCHFSAGRVVELGKITVGREAVP